MSTCTTCGAPLAAPTASDNRRLSETLEISPAILPALADALAIGRNTQMMCSGPRAAEMMAELHKLVSSMIPEAVKLLKDRHWAEIASRAMGGEAFTVETYDQAYWSKKCKIRITSTESGRSYPVGEVLSDTYTEEEAERIIAGLREELDRISPLSD